MKLTRKGDSESSRAGASLDRRTFLRHSGLAVGAAAMVGGLQLQMMRRAEAEETTGNAEKDVEIRRSVCTHCSVGCGVIAEVKHGVWIGQEPDFDSPINLGAHCAKGASVREHAHSEKRLKHPLKLVGGKWKRISWDQAIDEIGDKLLQIRKESGPDALFFCGSSKASNEGAYLQRKQIQ